MRYQISNIEFLKEMLKSIPEDDSCIEWTRGKCNNKGGYGAVRQTPTGKVDAVHRVAYILSIGAIPEGLCVLHKCDNPPCFRPSHLFLGTRLDNNRDRKSKGRSKPRRGERHLSAKLTEEQVINIRQLYSTGEWPLRKLSYRYGLTRQSIWHIVKRLTWTHI